MYVPVVANCDCILKFSNLCYVMEYSHRMGLKERGRSDRI